MATAFGKRLKAAREHAGLTQPELAAAVPMAQSTLAAAESKGDGSRLTAQIAHTCGVNAYWLATGNGAMLDRDTRPATAPPDLAAALPVVLQAVTDATETNRGELEQVLALFARTGSASYATRLRELLGLQPTEVSRQAANG